MPTCIVTGASGLLGRAVFETFLQEGWDTVGFAFSRAPSNPNFRKVDLRDASEVDRVVAEIKPDVIVHCAAERSPDVAEKDPGRTRELNVEATRNLSTAAGRNATFLIYISTDNVFDGKNPPYDENAATNPLSEYGRSKLAGELTVQTSSDFAILRIPVLYGPVEKLSESAVTVLFEKLQNPQPCFVSHYEQRFPTHVRDVALATLFLADRRINAKDSSIRGVFHWSAAERMTKYETVIEMGRIFEVPTGHISADKNPAGGAPRPRDSQLSCQRLHELGLKITIPFAVGIKDVLQPFVEQTNASPVHLNLKK